MATNLDPLGKQALDQQLQQLNAGRFYDVWAGETTSSGSTMKAYNWFTTPPMEIQMPPAIPTTEHLTDAGKTLTDLAVKAGFITTAKVLTDPVAAERRRKLAIATEHFPWVTTADIDWYNDWLKDTTTTWTRDAYRHDQLVSHTADSYRGIPPQDVLEKVSKANDLKCFDQVLVFDVQTVAEARYHDPIVFGSISGSDRLFFIAQWGEDVKFDDLVRK